MVTPIHRVWHVVPDEPPDESHRYLFVSYTSREAEVRQLRPFLDAFLKALPEAAWRRFGIWYDGVDLPQRRRTDLDLARQLTDAISICDFTTAFVSPLYLGSRWCQFEWVLTEKLHGRQWILPLEWKSISYLRHFARWKGPYRVSRCTIHPHRHLDAVDCAVQAACEFVRARRSDSEPRLPRCCGE